MRIGYSEEENFPGQFSLWQANCARSLRGRAGQKSLRELEAALLALPSKRLLNDIIDNGVDCCAIGALARQKGISVALPAPDHEDEDEVEEGETEAIGVECGMPPLVAWKVVEWNDIDLSHVTPEERYERVLKTVQKLLMAKEATK